MRPQQWVKNLFVLAPSVFAKGLGDGNVVERTLFAVILFCFASSAVYVMNDLVDAPSDRRHPIKRNRPIANKTVSPKIAIPAATLLFAAALGGASLLGIQFASSLLGYTLLNVVYSFRLKRLPYIDVLCIATGFELRVVSGAFAAQVSATSHLLLVTFLLSAFLGFSKRFHEISQTSSNHLQREALRGYSKTALTSLLTITGALTIIAYASYTWSSQTRLFFDNEQLPWTIPFTIFGVARFIYLLHTRDEAESPTEEMLKDWPFLLNLGLWGLTVLAIIYIL